MAIFNQNGLMKMSKITAISQEIFSILAVPAGSHEEKNTLALSYPKYSLIILKVTLRYPLSYPKLTT